MVRARSLAALAAAAAVPALSHASSFTSPSFSCPVGAGLSSINWGDMTADNVSIIVVAKPGAAAITGGTGQFSCSDSGVPTADLVGESFSINFGGYTGPTDKWNVANQKVFVEEKDFVETDPSGLKIMVSDFDTLLPAVQDKSSVTNFLGIEMKWEFGEAGPGPISFNVNADGQLILDPLIPPSGLQVSLYSTPQATTPEPGTMMLLGTGLLGIAGVIRRKKH